MRVIILGVSGLIGHQLFKELLPTFEVYGTLHRSKKHYGNNPLFIEENIIENIDVLDFDNLKAVLFANNPDVILNCVGVTKRKIKAENFLDVMRINSLFPHQLADWAKENRKRVVHFSTDCVFDGEVGNYTEQSSTTAKDTYGKTKALGEIHYEHTLTIRSSFIGRELLDKTELLEWFLSQSGRQIKGYKNTRYSGVSTIFMSCVVKNILLNFPDLNGLYQLSPENAISKYDLLIIAKKIFKSDIDIIPEENQRHTPTLDGSKLRKKISLKVPSWEEMMIELANEA